MSASRQFTISRLARIDGEWGSAGSAYGDPGEGSTGRLSAYPVSEYIRYNPVVKWNVIVVRREPATFDQATPRDAPRPQGRLIRSLHSGRVKEVDPIQQCCDRAFLLLDTQWVDIE